MPQRRKVPPAQPAESTDPLFESVDRLSAEVRVLRDVLAEIREDFSWVTRNGLPIQPVEHVHVRRMARDVNADDWSERLVIERTLLHPPGQLAGIATPELRRLTEDLQSAVDALMQGQVEPILKAVDEVQAALMDAMQHSETNASAAETATTESMSPLFPTENPPEPSVPAGRLF